ncbi:MAG TPA: hypothetical protein VGZ93_04990 [Candidatus Methylacidiphilales bacterium]|jgi:hypothetical protein|nr:hypothetical protein [Candidatus Methylacidiphilales bacterium]
MSDETTSQKNYNIVYGDKTLTVQAEAVAWSENGEFILLMVGEEAKHVIVAANVIAVIEQ